MKQTFKVPNALISDSTLSFSARRVGTALYGHRNAFGMCRKSFKDLASLAGVSPATARKAVEELKAANYIATSRTYHFSKIKGIIYGKTAYTCDLSFPGGFTLIPRSLFHQTMTSSAFVVCLCVYMEAGNQYRAYPSISRIMAAIGAARSTVCCAIQRIKALPMIIVQLCRKVNRAFSSNSYLVNIIHQTAIREKPVEEMFDSTPSKRSIHKWIIGAFRSICNFFSKRVVVRFLAS